MKIIGLLGGVASGKSTVADVFRKQLATAYADKVHVYFEDFPLETIHPWARTAAIAGRCLYRDNSAAFWQFHDWIYENQASVTVENISSKLQDFAKEKGDLVAKYLAVYLRAWAWIKAHPKEAREMMKTFYAQGGVEISDQGMDAEFGDRPVYSLDEQISNMNRSAGSSKVDTWLGRIGEFMKATGTIAEVPDSKSYIDDTYMKKIAADPTLKAMAINAN